MVCVSSAEEKRESVFVLGHFGRIVLVFIFKRRHGAQSRASVALRLPAEDPPPPLPPCPPLGKSEPWTHPSRGGRLCPCPLPASARLHVRMRVHAPALRLPVVCCAIAILGARSSAQPGSGWASSGAAPACFSPPGGERLFCSGQQWKWERLPRSSSPGWSPCHQERHRPCRCLFSACDGRRPVLTQDVGWGTPCPDSFLLCFTNTIGKVIVTDLSTRHTSR